MPEPEPEGTAQDPAAELAVSLVQAVLADWKAHGATAIASVRAERPHDYLKLVTGLLPTPGREKADRLDELTDEQLAAELARLLAKLAATGAGSGAGDGAARPQDAAAALSSL